MCVESRATIVCPAALQARPGARRQRPPSARHTSGIAGHFHSRAVATRRPRPAVANKTFGAQIAIAAGTRARSAAPSNVVMTR